MQSQTFEERMKILQKCPRNIRNICIMAHVDHGKTTLADTLIASNGIISQKMSGKLRYMDSRQDEQERGITMKSSAIALQYKQDDDNFLINLIDSPGHVDFTGEVSSAIQLCDGAFILVDIVEGVCVQTKVLIRQAWMSEMKMVLVINKMDRLITELKYSPIDAYVRLQQVLEQVNAVVGELFASTMIETDDKVASPIGSPKVKEPILTDQVYDWSSGLDETDDSTLYFSPDQGNVVFASGIDGWGFRIHHFAKMYAQKLGVKEDILVKTLWGDYYLNTKTKRIMKGAQAKAMKSLFVQFILENIWAVYSSVVEKRDKAMTEKIVKSLNIKLSVRDAKHIDPKVQLQSIFNQWLPLAPVLLEMACEQLPSPCDISEQRAEKLMCTKIQRFEALPPETQKLKSAFTQCNASPEAPLIIFISKMCAVDRSCLPRKKVRMPTEDEINRRRELVKKQYAEKKLENNYMPVESNNSVAPEAEPQNGVNDDGPVFVAFARIFSGTVRQGQQLFVLGPKHDPTTALEQERRGVVISSVLTLEDLKSNEHITVFTVEDLFVMMGRELESLDEIPAGNILGIGQLGSHVVKSATLSSTLACPPFTDLSIHTVPILRVALETAHSGDMPALVRGLKLLNQADANVRVMVQETGEHVIITAGQVHLQRCLDDLRQRFAKVEINVSSPIVPFKETIVLPPKLDMVNEVIDDKQLAHKSNQGNDKSGAVEIKTSNKLSTIKISAIPLPEPVAKFLDESRELIKAFDKRLSSFNRTTRDDDQATSEEVKRELDDVARQNVLDFKSTLDRLFTEAGAEWHGAVEQVWAFGPGRCGPNILLCRIPTYRKTWFQNRTTPPDTAEGVAPSHLSEYDSSFVSGFQMATNAGPLCEEPMRGVCFVVESWTVEGGGAEPVLDDDGVSKAPSFSESAVSVTHGGALSGQIMCTVCETCRRAFQAGHQRLMVAMYSCNIFVSMEALGKMYAVLGRCNGRVLHADLQEGTAMFNITAVLPVVDSFDFASELRRQTSGQAMPQLAFSHWEVIDTDPFWVPTTEEEYLLYGEKADSENRARHYVNAVRKRKGLAVDEKIVEHAEKQRTLTRNK